MVSSITKISVALNVMFAFCLAAVAFKFRDTIRNKIFRKKTTIVMFGNSLTKEGNWTKLLGRNDVTIAGVAGHTTSHFLWSVSTSVIKKKPKICFIEGGINDLRVGIPLKRTVENITTLIDSLHLNAIIPVLTSTVYTSPDTFINKKVDSLNILVKEIATQKNVQYVDLNDKLAANHCLKSEYTIDGIHLTENAYPIWAEKVKAILAEHDL